MANHPTTNVAATRPRTAKRFSVIMEVCCSPGQLDRVIVAQSSRTLRPNLSLMLLLTPPLDRPSLEDTCPIRIQAQGAVPTRGGVVEIPYLAINIGGHDHEQQETDP